MQDLSIKKTKCSGFLCNIPHKYPSQTTQYSMHFLGLFRFIAHICSSCVTDLCSTKPSQKEEREITPKNIQGYTQPWAKPFLIPKEKYILKINAFCFMNVDKIRERNF